MDPHGSGGCSPLSSTDLTISSRLPGTPRGPVPLEYSTEWLTCAIASRLDVVMVGLPGAAQDRLPAHVPGTRPGRPGVPRGPGEGCGAAGAPARERGAAPAPRGVRYEPADRVWLPPPARPPPPRGRGSSRAGAGPKSSP